MELNREQENIIDEFASFDDWMDKYNLLIEMGRTVPVIDPKYKIKDFLIEGCQSKVWLYPEYRDGKVFFSADSDALITKGIVSLLIRIFSGKEPDEIISAELYFIDRIGLRQNLSPTRSNGLLAMIRQMKLYAMAFRAKNPKA
jgi:cysteine desulfuration protein SufE